MWLFIIAGAVYLLGVAAVLVIRPLYMFTPDGDWKEFGIGQNEDRYTPFPFWLFCLAWAIISYFIVFFVSSFLPQEDTPRLVAPLNMKNTRHHIEYDDVPEPVELPKGYYVLNKKATKLSGVPKYVYLGAEEPTD